MQNVWDTSFLVSRIGAHRYAVGDMLQISTALSEIVVGTVAQLIIGAIVGPMGLAAKSEWIIHRLAENGKDAHGRKAARN